MFGVLRDFPPRSLLSQETKPHEIHAAQSAFDLPIVGLSRYDYDIRFRGTGVSSVFPGNLSFGGTFQVDVTTGVVLPDNVAFGSQFGNWTTLLSSAGGGGGIVGPEWVMSIGDPCGRCQLLHLRLPLCRIVSQAHLISVSGLW
jgi:hypothetical protein